MFHQGIEPGTFDAAVSSPNPYTTWSVYFYHYYLFTNFHRRGLIYLLKHSSAIFTFLEALGPRGPAVSALRFQSLC